MTVIVVLVVMIRPNWNIYVFQLPGGMSYETARKKAFACQWLVHDGWVEAGAKNMSWIRWPKTIAETAKGIAIINRADFFTFPSSLACVHHLHLLFSVDVMAKRPFPLASERKACQHPTLIFWNDRKWAKLKNPNVKRVNKQTCGTNTKFGYFLVVKC